MSYNEQQFIIMQTHFGSRNYIYIRVYTFVIYIYKIINFNILIVYNNYKNEIFNVEYISLSIFILESNIASKVINNIFYSINNYNFKIHYCLLKYLIYNYMWFI